MADIVNIVTEIETIANAQVGIGSFKYANSFEMNEFRTQTRPLMILHKQRTTTFTNFEKKFKDIKVVIGIYDSYHISEQKATSYASKQKELEDLMEQFIKEFRSRSLGQTVQVTSNQDWFMSSGDADIVNIDLMEISGNDLMIGIEGSMTIRTFTDCDTGVFNY